ncbi:CIC11C00000005048 [Sungouiella intermedia]|uniref:CIC11C00000005048 n=1 Tax=Sungouiella intermedia TaxID=45354 RepID=A0A1L0DJU5_9ASCO|nr:CIC11C00000005048 [[Candida] intermedia]
MTSSWFWFFGKTNSPPHTPPCRGSRKRDRLRSIFSKQNRHKICDCQEGRVVAESTPEPQTEPHTEHLPVVEQSEVILDTVEPITIEEVGQSKQNVECFTLLKVLRLDWMKSQKTTTAHSELQCAPQIHKELGKPPRSLYFLQDIGPGSSTTEVSAVTGMQA